MPKINYKNTGIELSNTQNTNNNNITENKNKVKNADKIEIENSEDYITSSKKEKDKELILS